MQGKICVVTGANSGIGRSMAETFAGRGAEVILVCRNEAKGVKARDEIRAATGNEVVDLELADVGSMSSVRELAERLAARLSRIDVLCNNAGVYLPDRQESEDGHEMMFAINHLGAFLLTVLTRDLLRAADQPRVVTTSSMAHKASGMPLDDLQCERRAFIPMRQYGLTKLANILFTKELAERFADDGVIATSFHPGAVGTGFAQDEPGFLNALMKVGKVFLRTSAQGADTGVFLATDPTVVEMSGGYFSDRKLRKPSKVGRDPEVARALWEKSEALTGLA